MRRLSVTMEDANLIREIPGPTQVDVTMRRATNASRLRGVFGLVGSVGLLAAATQPENLVRPIGMGIGSLGFLAMIVMMVVEQSRQDDFQDALRQSVRSHPQP